MSLYCSTLPREKRGKNCWNTPTSKQLPLTNAQLGTRQLRKRCGEIVNHPCGSRLYTTCIHPSMGFTAHEVGSQNACSKQSSRSWISQSTHGTVLLFQQELARIYFFNIGRRLPMEGCEPRPFGCNGIDLNGYHVHLTASPSLVGRVSCTRGCAKFPNSEMTTNPVSSLVPFLAGSRKGSVCPSTLLFFLFSASV